MEQVHTTDTQESVNVVIESVFEDGYWWIAVPDEVWAKKEMMAYYDGYPIWTSWSVG